MPSKEIKELRQAGKLEEALTMAQEELSANPENIWGKRNISWVYYEYLKKYIQESNFEGFIENLLRIKNLNLPEDDHMIFDTSAWKIASMVFTLQNSQNVDYAKINQVFDLIKSFHFTKPSDGYSLLLKAFVKGHKNWSRFVEFADWWNFKNLQNKDFQTEEYQGRELSALADKTYGAYAKELIEGEVLDAFGAQRKVNKDKVQEFLPKLDSVIDNHPDYQFLTYYKAQLLLKLGDDENVLEAFLPFARQKSNDFWVWTLMAEIFQNDKELEFSCYCKALSLGAPDKFLLKTRQVFSEILIKREWYNEAKTEIANIISVREKEGWRIPNEVMQCSDADWYKNAEASANNKKLYGEHVKKAEELLYNDLPEHFVAVEFVNNNRNILNFVKDKSLKGFFNYEAFLDKPQIGDVLKVRLKAVGDDGFHKALTIDSLKDTSGLDLSCRKDVSAPIDIPNNKPFGFVEDVFISPDLLKDKEVASGDFMNCKAILSFNKSKSEWGWKAFDAQRSDI